jgi:hypothetical protein
MSNIKKTKSVKKKSKVNCFKIHFGATPPCPLWRQGRLTPSRGYVKAGPSGVGYLRAPGMVHLPSFWRKPEVIKCPPLPDGRATPTRQGQFSEMERLKEA